MEDYEKVAATTVWRRQFYRRSPGPGWLLSLVLVPLLLTVIRYDSDWAKLDGSGPKPHGVNFALPSAPGLEFSPLTILRNGNTVTLDGDLPDIGARKLLSDMVTEIFGSDVKLVDKLNIKSDSSSLDLSGLNSVLMAAAEVSDFNFNIGGGTVTFAGTVTSDDESAAVEEAAREAWPNLGVVNEIRVRPATGPVPGPASGPAEGGRVQNHRVTIVLN